MFDYYNITDHLPDSVEPTWTVVAVVNSIAAPPTIIINFLIIWTILMDKDLRKVTYNVLLAVLAISDLLVGLLVEPLYSWYLVALLERRPIPCHFVVYSVPTTVLGAWTLITLMAASVDLYLAIEHPQFYLEHVTTKKVIIGTAVVWVVNTLGVIGGAVFTSLLQLDSLKKLPAAIGFVLHVLVTLVCTAKVQIIAQRQRNAIQAQVQAVQQDTTEEASRRRQQFKHALNITVIVLATFLLYCPNIVSSIIQLTKGKDITDDFQYISHPISVTSAHLQSLVNPILISLRLSYIREGVKNKLLCR